jgi:predicted  nucleic acid-binding Zn-ribbon protein
MITDMVAKLEEEARKEASKEAKCKQDKQKGTTDLKVKKGDFERLGSRLDGSNAKFVLLGEEISDLQQQLRDLDVSVRAATDFRNKDRTDNNAVIADSAESVEALSSAISVLTDFYGESAPALIQTASKKQSDSANVIMSILQTAQEDFEKLKQDTEAAESSAQSKYDKDMQAADVSKAKKTAMVEAKTAEKSTVKVMISQITEDLANATKAYDAAKDFLKGVMEACANKAMSFEERQARREAEIAGLKDALEILSPDAEFVQTRSFLAKGSQ